MRGHTDTASINSRRPLSDGMRKCLAIVEGQIFVRVRSLDIGEQNSMRALCDRGLVEFYMLDATTGAYRKARS